MEYEIKVVGKNNSYAKLLLKSYAGRDSEQTAINSYIFQSIYLRNSYPEISKVLENIAINEMEHFFYLGQAINMLGLVPVTGCFDKDNVLRLWDSSSVMFYTSLKDIFEADMKGEYEGIKVYNELISSIDDIYIKDLLRFIISQEEEHIKLLNDLYSKYIIN